MLFLCRNIFTPKKYRKQTLANKIINTKIQKEKSEIFAANSIPQMHYGKSCKGKAPYATTTLSASVTVEAALIMPVVIMAFMVLLQVLIYVQIQVKVQSSLFRQAIKAAGYSYFTNKTEAYLLDGMDTSEYETILHIVENGISEVVIANMVYCDLGDEFFQLPWIEGGKEGMKVIFNPWVQPGEIDIVLYYRLQPLFNLFGVADIPIVARVKLGEWTGVSRIPTSTQTESSSESIVYITKSGTVYHTNRECSYIKIQLSTVSMGDIDSKRNQAGGKYYRCSYCCTELKEESIVYISRYGDRYHQNSNCSKIARNVTAISIEEIGSRSLCQRCRINSE